MTRDATSPPTDREPGAGDSEPDAVGSGTSDTDLDALMVRLSGIADQVDAPPPLVAELARAAFETRDPDAELAVLTADSDIDTLALTRAAATVTAPRMVSFEADSVTVDLQFDHGSAGVTVTGVVHGPAVSAEVETVGRRDPLGLDRRGWFRVDVVAGQQIRFRVRTAAGVVCTAWVIV